MFIVGALCPFLQGTKAHREGTVPFGGFACSPAALPLPFSGTKRDPPQSSLLLLQKCACFITSCMWQHAFSFPTVLADSSRSPLRVHTRQERCQ